MPQLPQMQMPFEMPQAQQAQPVNGVIKVSGRQSAEAYMLPPNSTSPALFDANGKTFYIKTTDGAGIGTVEAFDFFEQAPAEQPKPAEYVTKGEFDKLAEKVDSLIGARYVEVPQPVPTAAKPDGAGVGAGGNARGEQPERPSATPN